MSASDSEGNDIQDGWPVPIAELSVANVNFYEDAEHKDCRTRFMDLVHAGDDSADDCEAVATILSRRLLTREQFEFRTALDGNVFHWLFLCVEMFCAPYAEKVKKAREKLDEKLKQRLSNDDAEMPVTDAIQLVQDAYVSKASRPVIERVKQMARILLDPKLNPYIRKGETDLPSDPATSGAISSYTFEVCDCCSINSTDCDAAGNSQVPACNAALLQTLLLADKSYRFCGPATYVYSALQVCRQYTLSRMLPDPDEFDTLEDSSSSTQLRRQALEKWHRGMEVVNSPESVNSLSEALPRVSRKEVEMLIENYSTMIPKRELVSVLKDEMRIDLDADVKRRERHGLDEEERAARDKTERMEKRLSGKSKIGKGKGKKPAKGL